MSNGFSHVGVSTHDMERTIHFYEHILGFRRVIDDRIRVAEGGNLRHVFFEVGEEQSIGFLEPQGVPGMTSDYDTDINQGLGLPPGVYHYAFRVSTLDELEARRVQLEASGVTVSRTVDMGGAKSIYFQDPNGLQLEFQCSMEPLPKSIRHGEYELSMKMLE
jgi:catechol 2,3-dioxygenase-like lactoylglutathione lyase family enzyme